MNHHKRITRTLAIIALIALVAPFWAPMAAAQIPTSAGGSATGSASAAAKSVGTFQAAPTNTAGEAKATGAVVSSVVADSTASSSGTGIIRDYSINSVDASGATSGSQSVQVFESIDVEGFAPQSRLEGVSTSTLTLRSADLAIKMTDSASALLIFTADASAQSDQQITFTMPGGVSIRKDASQSASTHQVYTVSTGATGQLTGALVVVDATGNGAIQSSGDAIVTSQNKATATLKAGQQLIFRANTEYKASTNAQSEAAVASWNSAVVSALAQGRLVAEATTEFTSGASLIANTNYFQSASARTESEVDGRVETTVRGMLGAAATGQGSATGGANTAGNVAGETQGTSSTAASATQVLAYDLDYADVPAQDPKQVGVFVNGALASRAESAAEFQQKVAARQEAYYAHTVDGRVLVLASANAQANVAKTVTVAALGSAAGSVSTLAELDAKLGIASQLQGSFTLIGSLAGSASGSGQVLGSFSSFFASEAEGRAVVEDYADVRSSTTIFTKIDFAAQATAKATADVATEAAASGTAAAGASGAVASNVKMVTKAEGQVLATATFTDTIQSTIVANAEAATEAQFHLADDVHATLVSENVIRLDAATGVVGYIVLADTDGSAKASGSLVAQAQASATAQANAVVKAQMDAGTSVIYRSSAEAHSQVNAEASAKAMAAGSLASEISASAAAQATATADYQSDIKTKADAAATAYGSIAYEVVASGSASQNTAIALTTDQATLPAASADDIIVKVNGEAASKFEGSVSAFYQAVASGGANAKPQYMLTTTASGHVQVLTSLAMSAAATAKVTVESKVAAELKKNSELDMFGAFRGGYGGAKTGNIASMIVKPEAGLLLDYTVATKAAASGQAKVFDAVQITQGVAGSADASAAASVTGRVAALAETSASSASSLRYASDVGTLEVFDVSGAVMKVTATASSTTTFDVAKNVEAKPLNPNVVMLNAPDFSGAIIVVQSAQAQGQAATGAAATGQSTLNAATSADASAKVTAQLEAGAVVIFKAFSGFESALSTAQKEAQAKAIAAGTLLGHVVVNTNTAAELAASASGSARAAGTTTSNIEYYSKVDAVTQVATAEKVQVAVDAATKTGKSIIISLDRDTVPGLIEGDAKLFVDGRAIAQASSYEDALTPGSVDKYWLITTEGEVGLQAIVSLAHFSTRTIAIETPNNPLDDPWIWATGGLALVVIGQAIYPRLRRKW